MIRLTGEGRTYRQIATPSLYIKHRSRPWVDEYSNEPFGRCADWRRFLAFMTAAGQDRSKGARQWCT